MKWEDKFKQEFCFNEETETPCIGECLDEEYGVCPTFKHKQFITTLLKEQEEKHKKKIESLRDEIENPSYCGVLHSNEKRRGYDTAITECLEIFNKHIK